MFRASSNAQNELSVLNNTSLYAAALHGDVERVRDLIQLKAEIDYVYQGFTPVYAAAHEGHTDVVILLCAAGANIKTCKRELNPLLGATQNNHLETVKVLIENGAKAEALFSSGETLLYRAAKLGQTEIVRALIQGGANLETRFSYWTPLFAAAQNNHVETVKVLIRAGANVEATLFTAAPPLYHAAYLGLTEVVRALIEGGANVETRFSDCTPLFAAIQNNHVEVAKLLIKYRADVEAAPSSSFASPLYHAAYLGRADIISALIEGGANVETCFSGWTPLFSAVHSKHVKAVQALILGGANVEASIPSGETPLCRAVQLEHAEMIRVLIQAGADMARARALGSKDKILGSLGNNISRYLLWQSDPMDKCMQVIKRDMARLDNVTLLRQDPTSYLSLLPRDMFEHVLAPMVAAHRFLKPR